MKRNYLWQVAARYDLLVTRAGAASPHWALTTTFHRPNIGLGVYIVSTGPVGNTHSKRIDKTDSSAEANDRKKSYFLDNQAYIA